MHLARSPVPGPRGAAHGAAVAHIAIGLSVSVVALLALRFGGSYRPWSMWVIPLVALAGGVCQLACSWRLHAALKRTDARPLTGYLLGILGALLIAAALLGFELTSQYSLIGPRTPAPTAQMLLAAGIGSGLPAYLCLLGLFAGDGEGMRRLPRRGIAEREGPVVARGLGWMVVLWIGGFGLLSSVFRPRFCIVTGSLVDTPTGAVAIERLEIGDEVWSRAPDGARRRSRVTATTSHVVWRHRRITLANGQELWATDTHPVRCSERWVLAGALRIGDVVVTRDGDARISGIAQAPGSVRVFDITVEPNANFLANGVVVHNKSRIGVNERQTPGTLRALATSQRQFQDGCIVDQDGDGVGEFGFFGELAGNAICRGTGRKMSTTPFIAAILGVRDASGITQKSGYMFRLYLAGANGVITEGNATAGEAVRAAAADAQELRWCCYAWPNARGQSGNLAFFVNQDGTVYVTSNDRAGQQYSGTTSIPSPSAALSVSGANPNSLDAGIGLRAAGLTAGDGGVWVPAGN